MIYEVPDSQHPAGLLLSRLPRRENIEAQSSFVAGKWQAGRAAEG